MSRKKKQQRRKKRKEKKARRPSSKAGLTKRQKDELVRDALRIVDQAWPDAGPASCAYAALVLQDLAQRRHGLRLVFQAGDALWRRLSEAKDDGVSPTHFGYQWDPTSPLSQQALLEGRMPELHVWLGDPERQEVIDPTSGFFPEQSKRLIGLGWQNKRPPRYLWVHVSEIPDDAFYKPNAQATILAAEVMSSKLHELQPWRKNPDDWEEFEAWIPEEERRKLEALPPKERRLYRQHLWHHWANVARYRDRPRQRRWWLENPGDRLRQAMRLHDANPYDLDAARRAFHEALRSGDVEAAFQVMNDVSDLVHHTEPPALISERTARRMTPEEFAAWSEQHDREWDEAMAITGQARELWNELSATYWGHWRAIS